MAALTRTAVRLLGLSRPNVRPALMMNSVRKYSEADLKLPGNIVEDAFVADIKEDRTRRNEIGNSSIEAFMQARLGVRRPLTSEEMRLAGGEQDLFEPESDMLQEYVDTIRGDMDTYDQDGIVMNEETAKIIGKGTHDDPVLIPTAEDGRYVFCFCPELDGDVYHMKLHLGERRTCNCGLWYQLVSF